MTSHPELADIQEDYLKQHYGHWPGEATTLGLHEYSGQLKDLSPGAMEDELQLHRRTKARLQSLDSSLLTTKAKLDIIAMTALHDFHIHFVQERADHLVNINMSLFPYQIVQFQQRISRNPDQWEALSARLGEIPRYLKQQQVLLQQGLEKGKTPDIDVVSFIANNQIPYVCSFFEAFVDQPEKVGVSLDASSQRVYSDRCGKAAIAYAEHAAFLRENICPKASVRTLGAEEYAWRLRHSLGVESSTQEIIEEAKDILSMLGDRLIHKVHEFSGRQPENIQEALAFVMEKKNTYITERDEDVLEAYRQIHERTKQHMRDRQLFHFGDEVDTLGFYPMPEAFAELGAVTNIAAPLLDKNGQAFFLIQPKVAVHAKIQAALLAVHEGIPGHGLQSIWWQTHRDRLPHTVRFLCVPDEVAVARQYFGSMMNIEGWATYAEVLMAEEDFFTPSELLWETWTKIAHASRVVVDASVHSNQMTVPEGVAFLAEDAGWPEPWAVGELKRYREVPLQSSCYLLGRLEILDLRKRCQAQEGASFSLADFHDRFFAAGPVAAGHLKKAWFLES